MIRKEKEIGELSEIESVIFRSKVCRLALCDDGIPYVVPLCFGYKDRTLWFHSARQGKKIEVLKKNNRVCVEFDTDCEVIAGEPACRYSMKYSSVIAFGTAVFVENPAEKRQASDVIMAQYGYEEKPEYSEKALEKMLIIKVEIGQMTGKRSM